MNKKLAAATMAIAFAVSQPPANQFSKFFNMQNYGIAFAAQKAEHSINVPGKQAHGAKRMLAGEVNAMLEQMKGHYPALKKTIDQAERTLAIKIITRKQLNGMFPENSCGCDCSIPSDKAHLNVRGMPHFEVIFLEKSAITEADLAWLLGCGIMQKAGENMLLDSDYFLALFARAFGEKFGELKGYECHIDSNEAMGVVYMNLMGERGFFDAAVKGDAGRLRAALGNAFGADTVAAMAKNQHENKIPAFEKLFEIAKQKGLERRIIQIFDNYERDHDCASSVDQLIHPEDFKTPQ